MSGKTKRVAAGVRKLVNRKAGENKRVKKLKADSNVRKKNHVVILLDESASMNWTVGKEAAVNAFNQQIYDIKNATKENNIDCKVSLVKFASYVRTPAPICWNRDASEMFTMQAWEYIPGGWTAMDDAIGYSIDRMKQEVDLKDENSSVLFVIISDGKENRSKNYDKFQIARMIKECQDSGKWTFTYSAANVDVQKVSRDYNIPAGNTQVFTNSAKSMNKATMKRTDANKQYYGALKRGAKSSSQYYSGANASDADDQK